VSGPLAALPMYDWPEVRAATDALWAAIRFHLLAIDIAAPAALRHDGEPEAGWRSPDLVLGQTCGLPFATALRDRVVMLGTPVYRLPDCPPGDYCSALVVRAGCRADTLGDLCGGGAAYNMAGSQSGHAALWAAAAPFGGARRLFARLLRSGSHRASIRAVAAGEADVAAIDAVSWSLARRHEPAAGELRVLAVTAPTPGLPYITARRHGGQAAAICAAVEAAIDRLEAPVRDALLLDGFRRRRPADYDGIAAAASALTDP